MGNGDWGLATIDAIGPEVGDGTAGALYCSLGGVVKRGGAGALHLPANEFIAGRLALCLGLPVPAGDLVRFPDGSLGYVSLRFGKEQPPRVIPAHLAADEPELAMRIVIFDCWVANDDRHEGNLAYSRGLIPPIVFDHDKAILGPGGDGLSGIERLEKVRDESMLNGCLVPFVKDVAKVSNIAAHIRAVALRAVPGICDVAQNMGAVDMDERIAVEDFLRHRAESLVKLVGDFGLSGQGNLL